MSESIIANLSLQVNNHFRQNQEISLDLKICFNL